MFALLTALSTNDEVSSRFTVKKRNKSGEKRDIGREHGKETWRDT